MKPKSKGLLSIIVIGAVLFSGVVVFGESGAALPSGEGAAVTNQVVTSRVFERVRQRLGEGNGDLVDIIRQKSKEKAQEAQADGNVFTVVDGVYLPRVAPAATVPAAVAFSQGTETEDYHPAPSREHISFSYAVPPARLGKDKSFLNTDDSPVAFALAAPASVNRSGVSAQNLAASDGVSRNIAALEDYVPAEYAPVGTSAKPNVIAPEPNTVVLFGIFGGALLLFFRRRAAVKRS